MRKPGLWLLLALTEFAAAQGLVVRGPVSGFVLDRRTMSLRSIDGIPGAARLGAPIPLPFAIRHAVVAPSGAFALAATAEDPGRLVVISGLTETGPVVTALDVPAGPDLVVFNRRSTAAALLFLESRRLLIVGGLPDGPAVQAAFEAPEGSVGAMALNDDGSAVLLGLTTPDGGALYVLRACGPRFLTTLSQPSAAVYLEGSRDAAVADRAGTVWLVSDVDGATNVLVAADSRDGLEAPAGLQMLAGGKQLLIADAGSRELLIFDLAVNRVTKSIALPSAPTRCDRLGALVLGLNDVGPTPLLVADLAQPGSVFFVPLD